MSYNWNEIQTVISEIKEYLELDGPTSETEAIECMIGVLERPDYVGADALKSILDEVKNKLTYYKTQTKIIEREETITRKVTELEWL